MMKHHETLHLYQHWRACRVGDALPHRHLFETMALAPLFRDMLILGFESRSNQKSGDEVDKVPGQGTIVVRYAGSRAHKRLGTRAVAGPLDAFWHRDQRGIIDHSLRTCMANAEPALLRLYPASATRLEPEWLALPIRDGAADTPRILCLLADDQNHPAKALPRPLTLLSFCTIPAGFMPVRGPRAAMPGMIAARDAEKQKIFRVIEGGRSPPGKVPSPPV